ncbi:MAG: PhoPQ-activated protein PqaA family protein, partial [Betaproteobacteria bacterium]
MPKAIAALLLAFTLLASAQTIIAAGLQSYVDRSESAFTWTVTDNEIHSRGTLYKLHLVSQLWQGIAWEHQIRVYVPVRNDTPATILLSITGDSSRGFNDEQGMQMANALHAPYAILYDVPNQPLLDGKSEDDLIAETFVRFLTTGDEDWPLLMPMTKSAVKAMDALQAFAAHELKQPIQSFVLTGASKRGWTSWLAAAVDSRVEGIAPMVFDMLNIPAQLAHQFNSWGGLSEMLRPYMQPGLPNFLGSPAGQRLLELVDPYSYREALGVPKLLILGTNDRYWTPDAPNLFWSELSGAKYLRYIPNVGHGLGDRDRWLDSMTCFFRSIAAGKRLPQMRWTFEPLDDNVRLTLQSEPAARTISIWSA